MNLVTQTEHGPLEAGSFGIDEQARPDLQSATASEPHIRPNRGRSPLLVSPMPPEVCSATDESHGAFSRW